MKRINANYLIDNLHILFAELSNKDIYLADEADKEIETLKADHRKELEELKNNQTAKAINTLTRLMKADHRKVVVELRNHIRLGFEEARSDDEALAYTAESVALLKKYEEG